MGVPHFALPFRLSGAGGFATNEQDSPEELASAVAVVLATPVGSRIEVPEFGSPRPEFTSPLAAATLLSDMVDAVQTWEPRVDLDMTALSAIGIGDGLTVITANVREHL